MLPSTPIFDQGLKTYQRQMINTSKNSETGTNHNRKQEATHIQQVVNLSARQIRPFKSPSSPTRAPSRPGRPALTDWSDGPLLEPPLLAGGLHVPVDVGHPGAEHGPRVGLAGPTPAHLLLQILCRTHSAHRVSTVAVKRKTASREMCEKIFKSQTRAYRSAAQYMVGQVPSPTSLFQWRMMAGGLLPLIEAASLPVRHQPGSLTPCQIVNKLIVPPQN